MGLFDDLRGQVRRVMLGQGRNFSQKRRHSRILCSVPIRLVGDKTDTRGRLVDLSLEGARIEVSVDKDPTGKARPAPKAGQALVMSLSLGRLGQREKETVVRIRWINVRANGWEIGLHLEEAGEDSWVAELLSEYGLAGDAFHTRRTQARRSLEQQVQVTLGANQTVAVKLVDLSLGGAAVVSSKALARFLPLRLTMTLAGKTTTIAAQVAHVKPYTEALSGSERLWLCGLRFQDLSSAQADLLGRHLVGKR